MRRTILAATTVALALVACSDQPSTEAAADDESGAVEPADSVDDASDHGIDIAAVAGEVCEEALEQSDSSEARRFVLGATTDATDDLEVRTEIRDEVDVLCGAQIADLEAPTIALPDEPEEPEEIDPEARLLVQRFMLDDALNSDSDLRDSFISVLDALGADSVDLVAFDSDTDTIRVSLTSRYRSEQNVIDDGWMFTRSIAEIPFWDPTVEWMADLYPALELELSHLSWSCDGEFMDRLSTARASRSDWETSC